MPEVPIIGRSNPAATMMFLNAYFAHVKMLAERNPEWDAQRVADEAMHFTEVVAAKVGFAPAAR